MLGRTRAAAVLRTIEADCTTGGLAQRPGISLASASEHATQLREAGLITTHRDGRAVYHTLSPLGQSLIRRGSSGNPVFDRNHPLWWRASGPGYSCRMAAPVRCAAPCAAIVRSCWRVV